MTDFCALFSGSSGNCTYISCGGTALLVDAGVSTRSICRALESIGSAIGNVAAVLVTHEHSDHIRGLQTMTSKYHIPVYANAGTIEGIRGSLALDAGCFTLLPTGASAEIGGMRVSSFATSHDSRESVGYRIDTPDGRRVAVATDLGYVSNGVLGSLSGCDVAMLESNHDVGMLQNGRYPYPLKRRILSNTGHLSNAACADTLPALYRAGTRRFVLAHLSRDNNLPELALATAVSAMKLSGAPAGDYHIEVAPRSGPEHLLRL